MLAAVVGIYAAVVITAAALVTDHHAWWPSALAAALAALALIPLRERLQRGVTRVVYGRWHEPYEVLAGLGQDLEAAADIDRLLDAVVAELTTGLDLRDVSVRDLDGAVVTGTAGLAGMFPHRDSRRAGFGEHCVAGLRHPGRFPDLPGAGSPAERGRGAAAARPGPAARRRAARAAAPPGSAARPGTAGPGPGRKNGGGCAGTCTMASARRWPG